MLKSNDGFTSEEIIEMSKQSPIENAINYYRERLIEKFNRLNHYHEPCDVCLGRDEHIASLERQLEECRGLLAAFKDAYSPEDDCYNTIATHREDEE